MTGIPLLEENAAVQAARSKWRYTGTQRPDFAEAPTAEQESVWDFPRPPRCEPVAEVVEVRAGEVLIARTTAAQRVLETAGAPTYYIPPQDVDLSRLVFSTQQSICEWKGRAQAFDVRGADSEMIHGAGWRYIEMFTAFAHLHEWCSFYPARVACCIGEQAVAPQPGGFYGGWVTPSLAGPIKGGPNSSAW